MNDKPKKITNQDIEVTNKDNTTQQEKLTANTGSQDGAQTKTDSSQQSGKAENAKPNNENKKRMQTDKT